MKFLKTYTSMATKSACSYNWEIQWSQANIWKQILLSSLNHTAPFGNLRYISGFSYVGGADSYQKSTWSLGDNYIKEYNDWFLEQQTQFLLGRYQIVFMALLYVIFFSNMLTHITLNFNIHPLCPR